MDIKRGDIIQIEDPEHHWFPCLLVVDEVKNWGVVAYLSIPKDNSGDVGHAPIRLETGVFTRVGVAEIVVELI